MSCLKIDVLWGILSFLPKYIPVIVIDNDVQYNLKFSIDIPLYPSFLNSQMQPRALPFCLTEQKHLVPLLSVPKPENFASLTYPGIAMAQIRTPPLQVKNVHPC